MTTTDEISTKPVPVPGFGYDPPRVTYTNRLAGPPRAARQVSPPSRKEYRTSKVAAPDPSVVIASLALHEYKPDPDAGLFAQGSFIIKGDAPGTPKATGKQAEQVSACGERLFARKLKRILKAFAFEEAKAQSRDELSRPLMLRSPEFGCRSDIKHGRWIAAGDADEYRHLLAFVTAFRDHLRTCSTDPTVRTRWLAKIEALGRLEKGWNGYRASAPTAPAVRNAKDLFEVACDRDIMPERVDASAIGGIGMTFTAGTREVVAELYNGGTAHALFADNATEEMDTRSISPTAEGYGAFLDEVRRYLYGQTPAR